jgi:hypothetical protein
MRKWSPKKLAWIRKAARGRVTVQRVCAGPETGFAPRFLPRVAGTNVSLSDRPPEGYLTFADAKYAGEIYRQSCRAEFQQ